jgi:hypothetical protein
MKRKININRKKISSDEISSGRNFQEVLNKAGVSGKTGGTSGKWLMKGLVGLGLAALVITAVILNKSVDEDSTSNIQHSSQNNNHTPNDNPDSYREQPKELSDNGQRTTDSVIQRTIIKPPLSQVNVEFQKFTLDADKGGTFTSKLGSKVTVPASSLLDGKGNKVSGKVEMRFREFHDPVDFFVSGIPMEYDSAGNKYVFESAGMMELHAFQSGKELAIDPARPLKVNLQSNTAGTEYNVYLLDTLTGKWSYKGKDKVVAKNNFDQVNVEGGVYEVREYQKLYQWRESKGMNSYKPDVVLQNKIDTVLQEIQVIQKEMIKIKETEPLEPKKANKERFRFNVEVDPAEFPEIAVYKNVQFEVDQNISPEFNEGLYKITWDNVVVSEGMNKGTYKLVLTRKGDKKVVYVYPVFEGQQYDSVITIFKGKFEEYTQKVEQKKVEEQKKQEEYKQLVEKVKKQEEEWKKNQVALQEQYKKEMEKEQKRWKMEGDIQRTFAVSSFGIWNCDNPMVRNMPSVNAEIVDPSGNVFTNVSVYHVDRSLNGLIQFYVNHSGQMKYSSKNRNLLWLVTSEGKLYWCSDDEFSKAQRVNGKTRFTLKDSGIDPSSPEQLKSLFKI